METCVVCSRPGVKCWTSWDGTVDWFCEEKLVNSQCFNLWFTPRMLRFFDTDQQKRESK